MLQCLGTDELKDFGIQFKTFVAMFSMPTRFTAAFVAAILVVNAFAMLARIILAGGVKYFDLLGSDFFCL